VPIERTRKDICVAALANQRPALRRFFSSSNKLLGASLYLGLILLLTSAAYADTGRDSAAVAGIVLAQAHEQTQAGEVVSSNEVKKYVAVYKAMQHNHRLSAEQAAATQGLTAEAFRDLEQRIEHNDVARDQARRALAESAQQTAPSDSGTSAPPRTPHP
jgi:predicted negative regulator of RcsB-dependent stress response